MSGFCWCALHCRYSLVAAGRPQGRACVYPGKEDGILPKPGQESLLDSRDYSSGRKHFAIPVRAGKRYELSAQIGTGVMSIHFAEVDPVLGTVAKHFPVEPETRHCVPGIPVGNAP